MIDLEKIFNGKDYSEEKAIGKNTKKIPDHKKQIPGLASGKEFERRIWRLFNDMGAQISNQKKPELVVDLKADHGQGKASQKSKQIDGFFIMRDKYAFVVECKDKQTESAKTSSSLMRQNFNDWQALKKPINNRLKKLFRGHIREPIHIIATRGYDWTKIDREKMQDQGFIILTDAGLNYLESCYIESKSSWFTFNQFLSFYRAGENDYGAGLKKSQKQYVGFRTRANPGKDGIDYEAEDAIYAYTTSMRVIDLLKISTVAHKKAEDIDELGENTKNYYQRILKKQRLSGKNNIPSFIKEKDGPFVNNVLINYRGEESMEDMWTSFDQGQERGGLLSFNKLSPGMFHIIDGQHRLFGYAPLIEQEGEESDYSKHELIITIFDKMEPQDEARNFLNINKNQKAIDASLVLEVQLVFGAHGPDDEVVENLATTLVQKLSDQKAKDKSPFAVPMAIKQSESMKKIDHSGGTVEQGALTIRGLVTHLVRSVLVQQSGNIASGYAFKDINGDKSDKFEATCNHLFDIYNQYFATIKKARPQLWVTQNSAGKNVSNKDRIAQNIPIGGFIYLLDHFIKKYSSPRKTILNAKVKNHINKLADQLKNMTDDDESALFDVKQYGGSGPKQFYHQLLEQFHPNLIDADTKAEIEKSRKEYNKISDAAKAQIEARIVALMTKQNTAKDINERLWAYEGQIRDTMHEVFEKIFGKDFWSSGQRGMFDDEFLKIGTSKLNAKKIADNARDKRKKHITDPPLKGKWTKDNEYPHMMMWLQWDHWYEILTEIIKKSKTFESKYSKFQFGGKYKDLQTLLKDLYFANNDKPAKQCSPAEGLGWFITFNGMRNPGSHPSKEYELMTPEEVDYFEKLDDKIKVKMQNILDFLTEK